MTIDMRPISVKADVAADLLGFDRVEDFLEMVDQGILPAPRVIGERQFWCYAELEAIFTGEAAIPAQEFT